MQDLRRASSPSRPVRFSFLYYSKIYVSISSSPHMLSELTSNSRGRLPFRLTDLFLGIYQVAPIVPLR